MANAFLNLKSAGGKVKPANNLPFLKPRNVGPKPQAGGLGAEVAQQNRRITGVTPRAIRSFAEKPASYLKKQKFNLGNVGK